MTEIVPHFRYGSIQLDEYPYGVVREEGGIDIGVAAPEMEEVQTLLANGGVLLSSRTNNRTLMVPVVVMGDTLKEVAENMAALYAECRKDYNEFSLTPGGLGAETIFDTFAATATAPRDDIHESALLRRVDLEIPAGPWPRSATTVTEIADFEVLPGRARQNAFTLNVAGAAPTEGSLHIEGSPDDLGDVMVYTCRPDVPSYLPNLRQYLSSAAGTTNFTMVSDAYNTLDTHWLADIPADNLPRGSYALWARLRSDVAGSQEVDWTSVAYMDSGTSHTVKSTTVSGTTVVDFPAANVWGLYPIARLQLPPMLLPATSPAVVRIDLVSDDPSGTITIDEAWVFNMTIGELTVISGTPLSGVSPPKTQHLWIDAPSIQQPKPTIWRGLGYDRSDSYGAGAYVQAWGTHVLEPPSVRGFLVTTGPPHTSIITLEHQPRWPDYAAD